MTKSRILIVDDHQIYRDGLRQFIESQSDLACCGEADSCQKALEMGRRCRPDLLVIDLRLHGEDGTEVIKTLRAEQPGLRILVLSMGDESGYAELALRAGAQGYIMKEQDNGELLNAIHRVLEGELYVSRRLSSVLLKRFFRRKVGVGVMGKLSDREAQVFQLLGSGLSTQQVAEQLHLSVKTVNTHRENIKSKLELQDAPSLLKAAREWVNHQER